VTGLRRIASGLAALGVAALTLTPPVVAVAAPGPQTSRLCAQALVTCSVQVAPVVAESSAVEVAVTGNANVTVDLQAWLVTGTGTAAGTKAFGPKVPVTTDGNGFGLAEMSLPELPDGESGQPVLFAIADPRTADLTQVLGTWSLLASRTPHVQGDGYSDQKPAGQPLALQLDSALAGATYFVEYVDAAGAWRSVSDPASGTCGDPAGVCVVRYTIPRGLPAADYAFRLVSQATGAVVDTWNVRPADDGVVKQRQTRPAVPAVGAGVPGSINYSVGASSNPVPRPRSADLDVPDVGSRVAGARFEAGAAVPWLLIAAASTGVAAFLLALLGAGLGLRRLAPRLGRELAVHDD
jgi:hypothetical protein